MFITVHLNFDWMNLLCNAVNFFPTAMNIFSIAVNLLYQEAKLRYFMQFGKYFSNFREPFPSCSEPFRSISKFKSFFKTYWPLISFLLRLYLRILWLLYWESSEDCWKIGHYRAIRSSPRRSLRISGLKPYFFLFDT